MHSYMHMHKIVQYVCSVFLCLITLYNQSLVFMSHFDYVYMSALGSAEEDQWARGTENHQDWTK